MFPLIVALSDHRLRFRALITRRNRGHYITKCRSTEISQLSIAQLSSSIADYLITLSRWDRRITHPQPRTHASHTLTLSRARTQANAQEHALSNYSVIRCTQALAHTLPRACALNVPDAYFYYYSYKMDFNIKNLLDVGCIQNTVFRRVSLKLTEKLYRDLLCLL